MGIGYIKLHRQIMENEFYFRERFTWAQAWIDLLLLANHEPNNFWVRGIRVDVLRGVVGHSKLSLSRRWKWNRESVATFISFLERSGMVSQKADNKTTLISILNYSKYQDGPDTKPNTKSDTKPNTKPGTNKNDKNEKNEKKKNGPNIPFSKELFDHVIQTWEAKRKNKYPIHGAKHMAILKNAAKIYQPWGVMALWDIYLDTSDDFYRRAGYSIEMFSTQLTRLVDNSGWKLRAEKYEQALNGGPPPDLTALLDKIGNKKVPA